MARLILAAALALAGCSLARAATITVSSLQATLTMWGTVAVANHAMPKPQPSLYANVAEVNKLRAAAFGSGAMPLASDVVIGKSELSVAPASAGNPIVTGDNDSPLPSDAQATYMTCAGTNDTIALNTAVSAGKPIVIPFGVTCATNDITIKVPLFVGYTGRLKPNTGKTATLTSGFWAGGDTPWQAFINALVGQGTVSFAGNAALKEVYPQWWGGDPTGVVDSAPAINAAEQSGAKEINMLGSWGLSSPIFLTTDRTVFDGKSRVGSRIYALAANIASGGSPNALFVDRINAWNGTLKSLRFPNHGVSYTGWIISAVEGGTTGEQAMFSGHFYDLWVDPGSLASGFFTGGVYDSWFHHIQFESCRHRFLLTDRGGGADNVQITNINETACYFPFLEAISTTPAYFSGIIIDDITVARHQNDYWIKVKNTPDLKVTNIKYEMNDEATGQTAGFASIENGSRISIGNFNARRKAGKAFTGIKLIATQARIHDGYLAGLNASYAFRLEGDGNDIDLTNIRAEGPNSYPGFGIDGSAGVGGSLRVSHCVFTASSQYVVNLQGTIEAYFSDSQLTNGNYGYAASVPLILINTSGKVVFQNNTIGTDSGTAKPTYAFTANGSGEWWMLNNRIIGLLLANLTSSATTQVPKLKSNFYVDTGTNLTEWVRTGTATPVGAVVPAFRGEEYLDTAAKVWYKATGYTKADWKALN